MNLPLPYISGPGEITNDDYHNSPEYLEAISSSKLVDYMISPKYARYQVLNPEEKKRTPAMLEGTVYHDRMESLVNHTFFRWLKFDGPINERTGEPYGMNTKAFETAMSDFISDNPGVNVCPEYVLLMVDAMVKELDENKDIQTIIKIGAAEQSHFVEYEGVYFKYRTDVKTAKRIIDWKTCNLGDPRPDQFARKIADYNYHIKAAFYQFFEHQITGLWKRFYWVAQEKQPPYDFNIISADEWAFEPINGGQDVIMHTGAVAFMKLLDLHIDCTRKQKWPGYACFIQPDFVGRRIAHEPVPMWIEKKSEFNVWEIE